MRKTPVGWEPGGLAFPSLLSSFFSSLSRSSSFRRFFKILFSSLTMFSFQRLPKTDSDASKENKETEVGSSFHKIDFHKMPFQRSSRERVLKTRETRSSPPSSASSATSCSWPTLARPSSSSLLSWDSAHSCQSTF